MRLFILLSASSASPALAQGSPEAPPLPVIECYCAATDGSRVEMGETICLNVDGRSYLARCEMSLNSPMWRDTGALCVGAALAPLAGAHAAS